MPPKPTRTNPTGGAMVRQSASIPVGDGEHLRKISRETNKPIPVLVREAVRQYIERYYLNDK